VKRVIRAENVPRLRTTAQTSSGNWGPVALNSVIIVSSLWSAVEIRE